MYTNLHLLNKHTEALSLSWCVYVVMIMAAHQRTPLPVLFSMTPHINEGLTMCVQSDLKAPATDCQAQHKLGRVSRP